MLNIKRIHIDYQTNPAGISEAPQFGWEMESDRRGVLQKFYELQIAEDEEFNRIVYDSGRIESQSSAQVRAEGFEIGPMRKYYVRAAVSDGEEQSGWGEAAHFITALTDPAQWEAPFVSAETDASFRECSKGTYVRGTFVLRRGIKKAFACTTALGLYNFYLNGQKVGDDEMTPGWTSYQKHLLYQTYEVTEYLREGENSAGAMLGAGWYKGVMGLTKARNNYGDQTGFAMQLLVRYEDGTQETVCTNDGWKGADSPIVFSEIYDGEIYDA